MPGSSRPFFNSGQCARDELSVAQSQALLLLSLLQHSPIWADHVFDHVNAILCTDLPEALGVLTGLASGRVSDVRKLPTHALDLCVAVLALLGGGFPTFFFGSTVAYRTSAGEVGEGTVLRRRTRGTEEDGELNQQQQQQQPPRAEGEGPQELVTILPASHSELVEVSCSRLTEEERVWLPSFNLNANECLFLIFAKPSHCVGRLKPGRAFYLAGVGRGRDPAIERPVPCAGATPGQEGVRLAAAVQGPAHHHPRQAPPSRQPGGGGG
jgi:hypothetical protein